MSALDADQALVSLLDSAGLFTSSGGGSGTVLGRPFFGLIASAKCDPGCAAFKSFKCLTSKIGSPQTLYPTFNLKVDLEIRWSMGNGPAKDGCRPTALCCFV